MQKDQSHKPWYKRLWVRIGAALTFLSIVTALFTDIFDIFDRFSKDSEKKEVIKIYGSVFEKKKELRPIYNASVRFLNIREERTDTNGYFSAQLDGKGADSITIEVVLPDEQKLNRKIFIEYNKKEMFLAPLVFPVNEATIITEIPKEKYPLTNTETFIPINSNKKNEVDKSPGSVPDIKQEAKPTEIINESEKADFAIMATTNEKQDNQLASLFVAWIKNSGTSSQSILQNLFIEQGFFNQIIDGNSAVIKKTKAASSAKYLCLVRSTVNYHKSEINDALTVLTGDCEIAIIETSTGKVIDSFKIPTKSSGITEIMAKQRAETDFINELNKRKLTI